MRIHFTGVAGAGMSAVALILREAGHQVSGSDEDVFPPMSTYVEGLGFPFHRTFSAANLPDDLDVLVLGASAKLGGDANPEVAEARRRGVRVATFPELLGEVTEGRLNTVVAGSFGKSTCSALMAHVLRAAGHDSGWMVGAISPALPDTGHWGQAPEMILEGDEYIVSAEDRRSKFALYHPRDVLLTSLIHDHLNVFPTFADYEAPFRALLADLPEQGLLVARDHPAIRAIAHHARCRIVWYDVETRAGWHTQDLVFGDVTRFALCGPAGQRVEIATGLLGAHNVENIVGVGAYLLERGLVTAAQFAAGVASFQGIRRRLDRLTKGSTVPVIEGFGSSYEKTRSAIEAMLLHYPDRPLTVVFEPHTFSWRNRAALPWYDTAFQGVAKVLVIPPPVHGAASHEQATHDEIVERLRGAGVPAEGVASADDVLLALEDLTGREVVLLLSSGPLLGLPDSLPPVFDARFDPARPRAASRADDAGLAAAL